MGVTTQLNRQSANSTLSRNFGTNDRMLRYKRIKSHFYTDTLLVTKKGKSTHGNTCAQIYVSDKGMVACYPMAHVRDFLSTLKLFAKEVGAPEVLVADPHPTHRKPEVRKFCNNIGTTLNLLEAKTQWANRAELYVGFLKEGTRDDTREANSPLVLWDYAMERRARIYQVTAKNLYQLQGSNPYTATFGSEADISNLCQFGWYEWVYFRDNSRPYPTMQEELGRCLGPAKNEGNEMAQWILTICGTVRPRRTVRRLTDGERAISNVAEKQKRDRFDTAILARLGDSLSFPTRRKRSADDTSDDDVSITLPKDDGSTSSPTGVDDLWDFESAS